MKLSEFNKYCSVIFNCMSRCFEVLLSNIQFNISKQYEISYLDANEYCSVIFNCMSRCE